MADKFLIVGLGNPGTKYKANRHNIGFMVVSAFAERHHLRFSTQQQQAMIGSGLIGGRSVVVAKPQTYMNKSGAAVSGLMRFYKIPLENLLVVVDDIDLEPGTLRLRPDGGHGGQNGMRDIISHLGTKDFARLRIGLGRPAGRMDAAAYVLQDFKEPEKPLLLETIDRAVAALDTWLYEGIELAMSRHNGPAPEATT